MNTCFEVANYFLKCQQPEDGDLMTNLKLQKLVYYAQGFYLAMMDKPLFNEIIEAWEHGPVCVDLYHEYKSFKSNPIPVPEDVNAREAFSEEALEVLDMIQTYYGQFSAWKLRNLTHADEPWRTAYGNKYCKIITQKSMKEYFKTQLADEDEEEA